MNATQTIDLEKQLLCTLMLGGGETVAEVVEKLKAKDFLRFEHRLIYSTILRLYAADISLDVRVVENELSKSGDLNRVKREYLWRLTELEYSPARAGYYAQEVLEASRKRRLAELGRLLAEGAGSATELLTRVEGTIAGLSGEESRMESALEIALRTVEGLGKTATGLRTGFIDLDKVTGGLKKSDLIILAARPSMGKTALGMNIAAEVAKTATVGVFSLEMSKGQLMQRLLSSEANLNAMKLQSGELREAERKAVGEAAAVISERKLYIDDTGAISLMELKGRARRLKREKGLGLIVVDYLQLMQASKEYRGNRVQEVSEISRGLKALAKELDVPVLALSQLSRAVEQRAEKKPVLSDLRESGSIEQDADIVLFLYREEYYNREEESNIAEVIVAKNRNGATGSIKLYFDKPTVTFRNLTRRLDD